MKQTRTPKPEGLFVDETNGRTVVMSLGRPTREAADTLAAHLRTTTGQECRIQQQYAAGRAMGFVIWVYRKDQE